MSYIGQQRPASFAAGIWHLDGSSADSSGNSNTGTDTAITYSSANGVIGSGAGLDGSTSFISVGSGVSLQNSTFTYMGWVNAGPASLLRTMIGNSVGVGGPQWRLNGSGNQELLKQGTISMGTSTTALTNGTSAFCAVTYDGSTVRFYKDGVADGTAASSQTFTFSTVFLGKRETSSLEFFNTSFDEIVMCSTVLTANQIKDKYFEAVNYGKYN